MTTIDLRSTQKVYNPKTDADKKIEEMEIRLKSITQTLNLILKKLDNYWLNQKIVYMQTLIKKEELAQVIQRKNLQSQIKLMQI